METEINKELLASNEITTRRKIPAVSFVTLAVAATFFAVSFFVEDGSELKMSLVFVSAILFIYGIAKLMSAQKVYTYIPTKEELRMQILYFENKEKHNIVEMLRKGDIDRIKSTGASNYDLPIKVELYSTESGKVALYRIYHYIPYTMEPLTDYEVFRK